MMTHYDRKAEARAKALSEVRHALGVSIIGAIKNAGDLDELGADKLRVVAKEAKRLLGFIFEQLESIEEAGDG